MPGDRQEILGALFCLPDALLGNLARQGGIPASGPIPRKLPVSTPGTTYAASRRKSGAGNADKFGRD